MGYISTGQTDGMVIYFTPKAIEYLMGKKTSKTDLSIKYFSLGDSDANYLINKRLQTGYVSDLSGEDTVCLKNVAVDFDNRTLYNQWLSNTETGKPDVPPSIHKSPVKA